MGGGERERERERERPKFINSISFFLLKRNLSV